MSKKKTPEQFCQEIQSLVGNEYMVLEPYNGGHNKLLFKHSICNHNFYMRPHDFLHGQRCPKCKMVNYKLTQHEVEQRILQIVGDEYTILSAYNSQRGSLVWKHNTCGHEYTTSFSNFIYAGTRCPKCAKCAQKNTEIYLSQVRELCGEEYTICGEYINSKIKIETQHNQCGHIYKVSPEKFLYGRRCPKCFGHTKKTKVEFEQEVNDLVGEGYTVIGEYVNTNTLIEIKHNECGHQYRVTPDNFLRGRRCPECSCSRGEKTIRAWLLEKDICFKSQYSFSELRTGKSLLRFDFAVFKDEDKQPICLIEFDGIQHFDPMRQFGRKKEHFDTIVKNDERKNIYCQQNNLKLVRVPYWDLEKIDEILDRELKIK